jgi:hypothetical protein
VVVDLAVSAVLVWKEKGIQKPVYYANKFLHDAEMRYMRIEKIALTLVSDARKLKLYFQAYQVIVLIDLPLR